MNARLKVLDFAELIMTKLLKIRNPFIENILIVKAS